jgi:hypothetical protein
MASATIRCSESAVRCGFGINFNAIYEALRAVNSDHCSPAMADDELRTWTPTTARSPG